MAGLSQMAFQLAPATLWRDDPIEAAYLAARRFGIVAPSPALQNAFLNTVLIGGRWGLSGYPVFQLTHRLAATLMATSVSVDALEAVRCPFYGVTVRIPPDLLYIANRADQPESAVLLSFTSYAFSENQRASDEPADLTGPREPRWAYCLSTNPVPITEDDMRKDGLSVWAFHVNQSKLLADDLPRTWDALPRTSMDTRADALARRLMLGLCLWCSDPKKLGEPMQSKRRSSERGRTADTLPDFKTWYLGREIKVDQNVIEAVRSFSREGGSSPKVQCLVSGHWKRQQHGPGRSLRKLIHVEPYWRGPLDAPVISHGGR